LSEVRQKVLGAFVCAYCREALSRDGLPGLADELAVVLRMDWLGKPSDPASLLGMASELGYDLFLTKGPRATPWESFKLRPRDLAQRVCASARTRDR
jgi:hypothetical protein